MFSRAATSRSSLRSCWSGFSARSMRSLAATRRRLDPGSNPRTLRSARHRSKKSRLFRDSSMSSRTWTPDALSSEARRLSGSCWRMVEAQHQVSTLKLVDSIEEQAALEQLVEQTKPNVPRECQHLDYLLSTPFRYGSA